MAVAGGSEPDGGALPILEGTVLEKGQIGLNDELVGDRSPVELLCDVQQVGLVSDLKDHSVGSFGDGLLDALTARVDDLGSL